MKHKSTYACVSTKQSTKQKLFVWYDRWISETHHDNVEQIQNYITRVPAIFFQPACCTQLRKWQTRSFHGSFLARCAHFGTDAH